MRGGAGPEGATSRLVRVPDPLQADDLAAGRQVGPRHEPHQVLKGRLGVAEQVPGGRDHLAEVVRGHVRGHADRDAGGTVDQQVREGRGQDLGLQLLAVVVGPEVDGLLVDARHHQHGLAGQPGLGVPHRRGRVVAAQ